MWAAVADKWADNADYIETRAAEINKALLDGAAVGPADRVLELASGPGGFSLALAAVAGEVVASDVVPVMVEATAARAKAAGFSNLTAKVLDLEEIDEPDASFDVVVIREGLMFAVNPAAAVGEIKRVLKPGGRVAVSVWGPKVENPWLAIVMDGVSEQLGFQVPPATMPGPFALADGKQLVALFRDAGFADIAMSTASSPLHTDSFEAWWERTQKLAGPVASIIAKLPDEAKAELEDRLRIAAEPYRTTDGFEFPGLTLVATASR
jgi:SAM-dependent methyltransferase